METHVLFPEDAAGLLGVAVLDAAGFAVEDALDSDLAALL